MKWFKRAWISLIRRPQKTLILFTIVFVMANLLAGSLAIVDTSQTIKENLKVSISPKVNLQFEETYIENKIQKRRQLNMNQIHQLHEIIELMKQDENVLSAEESYSIQAYASYSDMGWDKKDQRKIEFNFLGTNVIENAYFIEGTHKMYGSDKIRFLTPEELESDEPIIVVDYKMGHVQEGSFLVATGLCDIGNEVTLTLGSSDDENHEYKFKAKVVGYFTNNRKKPYENIVYISNKALMKIVDDANQYFRKNKATETSAQLESATLSMKTLEGVQSFEENTKYLKEQLPEGVFYESSLDIYNKNIGPVKNLDTVAQVIFIVAVFSTVIVLGLVIVFFILERKKEFGLYASLGEKKKNMMNQIIAEVVMISTLAILLASASGIYLGNKMSDYMLEVQRYVKREQMLGELSKVPALYKPVEGGLSLGTREEVISNYEITPSADYFIMIFLVGELSVVISCVLPMYYLSKLKPKEIML